MLTLHNLLLSNGFNLTQMESVGQTASEPGIFNVGRIGKNRSMLVGAIPVGPVFGPFRPKSLKGASHVPTQALDSAALTRRPLKASNL